MEENITGGVSPIKRRGKSRGTGKRGAGDTRYKRDKWKKPTGGGTSTIPSKSPPNPVKPYTMKDGVPVMNPPGNVYNNKIIQTNTGGYTTKTVKTPGTDDKYEDRTTVTSWQQGWDKMEDVGGGKRKSKYGRVFDNLEDYRVAGQEYNKRTGHTTKKTDRVLVEKGTEGTTTETKEYVGGGDNIANIYNSPNNMLGAVGKYKIGGYRAMKNNKK
tara:strand:- start:905 stop:1546 length:642 start_codon:yes stop_codon:yes gene_type:complete